LLKSTREDEMGLGVEDDGWRIPDQLWAKVEPLLPPRPAHPLGCHNPRMPDRDAMTASSQRERMWAVKPNSSTSSYTSG
jgi:hypothetical protein